VKENFDKSLVLQRGDYMEKELIIQLESAIRNMEKSGRDYDELHLSKEDCEYILKLIKING
jgi:hypothetical protein